MKIKFKTTPLPTTVVEWLQRIESVQIREKALRNTRECRALNQKARSVSDAIDKGFVWVTTDEGHQYWFDVFAHYRV